MLKKFTQNEYENLTIVDGRRQCPMGDYSLIKEFERNSDFAASCIFSDGCRFGEGCSFGARCSFSEACIFDKGCRFGERCCFGDYCSFREQCIVEGFIELKKYAKFEASELIERCTYFYKDVSGEIYVRFGTFLGTIAEFREEIKKTYKDSILGQGYQKVADLMEWQLTNI